MEGDFSIVNFSLTVWNDKNEDAKAVLY